MVEVAVEIPAPGLHARPAALLVQLAGRYACDITIWKDGKSASARSLLSLMALGLSAGATAQVRADGADAAVAAAAVAAAIPELIAGSSQDGAGAGDGAR